MCSTETPTGAEFAMPGVTLRVITELGRALAGYTSSSKSVRCPAAGSATRGLTDAGHAAVLPNDPAHDWWQTTP